MAPTNKDGGVATAKAVDVLKQKAGAHHCLGNVHANLPVNKVGFRDDFIQRILFLGNCSPTCAS